MGYESKLYIVHKTDCLNKDGLRYADVIAMFDMCNIGELISVFKRITDCYIFSEDGNKRIIRDKYGAKLKESEVNIFLNEVDKQIKNGNEYRRLYPLYSFLKSISKQIDNGVWDDIVILHYGY